jgi:hypothetical protein
VFRPTTLGKDLMQLVSMIAAALAPAGTHAA